MNQIIKPKRSENAGTVPTTSNLEAGEIAINLADKKLFVRDTSNNILELTTPAVKSRLHRARLFLRKKLANYFGGYKTRKESK